MTDSLTIFVPHSSEILTDHQPHGDGLAALGFITRLAERGHRLHVAAEAIDLARPLGPNVHLYEIKSRTGVSAARRLDYMRQVRALYHSLRREVHIDLIHQLNPVYTGLSLALWDAPEPLVLGPYVPDWPKCRHMQASSTIPRSAAKILRSGIALAQQSRASAILLTTEAARDRLVNQGRFKSRSFIVPHGIDSDFFRPDSSGAEPITERNPHSILFFANVSERKGIFDLLSAFELLVQTIPQAELLIAGTGEDLPAVQTIVQHLRSGDRIHFLGRKTRSEAVALYHRAAVYCLPSHGEPFGITVAEAMSCGCPVVVTDAGGLKHLVDDEGAVRVPVSHPDALAEALIDLMGNAERRHAMGIHNRQKVMNTITWDKVIDSLEDAYVSTIKAFNAKSREPRRRTSTAPQTLAGSVESIPRESL